MGRVGILYSLRHGRLRDRLTRGSPSSLTYRFAHGALFSLIGNSLSRVLAILASVLVARLLGRERFGELGIVQSTVGMLGIFAGFSLGLTATKHVASLKAANPQELRGIIEMLTRVTALTSLATSTVLFVFADWLAEVTLHASHLSGALRAAALIVFLGGITGLQNGTLAGFEAFPAIARIAFWSGLAAFPCVLLGAVLGGVEGVVVGTGATMLLTLFLNERCIRTCLHKLQEAREARCDHFDWGILWKFTVPAVLSGLVGAPVLWACNTLMVSSADGYGQMGVFSAANQWRSAILFLPGNLASIALPLMSSVGSDPTRHSRVLRFSVAANGTIALLAAFPIALLSRPIMGSYGGAFAEGSLVLVLLAVSAVVASINNVVWQAIVSRDRVWFIFFSNCVWAFILLGGFSLLSVRRDAFWLAIWTLVAQSLQCLWQSAFVWKQETVGTLPQSVAGHNEVETSP